MRSRRRMPNSLVLGTADLGPHTERIGIQARNSLGPHLFGERALSAGVVPMKLLNGPSPRWDLVTKSTSRPFLAGMALHNCHACSKLLGPGCPNQHQSKKKNSISNFVRMREANARTTPSRLPGPGWRRRARTAKQNSGFCAHHVSKAIAYGFRFCCCTDM